MKLNIKTLILFFTLFLAVSCSDKTETDSNEPEIEELNNLEEDDFTQDETQDETQIELGNSMASDMGWTSILIATVLILILGPGTIGFFIYFVPLKLWYEARLSGVKVSWISLAERSTRNDSKNSDQGTKFWLHNKSN